MKLILQYGEQVIFDTGLKILGFPGTLITHRGEAVKIENYLLLNKEIKK